MGRGTISGIMAMHFFGVMFRSECHDPKPLRTSGAPFSPLAPDSGAPAQVLCGRRARRPLPEARECALASPSFQLAGNIVEGAIAGQQLWGHDLWAPPLTSSVAPHMNAYHNI